MPENLCIRYKTYFLQFDMIDKVFKYTDIIFDYFTTFQSASPTQLLEHIVVHIQQPMPTKLQHSRTDKKFMNEY